MKFPTLKTLLGGMALMTGLTAGAQGLEGVIVEEYHTITQADADFINAQSPTYAMPVGAKVYRVYIDMAPNYRFLNVVASADNSNPVNFQTTTTFWNTTDMAGGSADFSPAQTRNLPRGLAFDSYITIHTTGKSGSTVLACTAFGGGSSANTQQVGVLRSADSNGNGTLCNSYPGFTGADGHIQNPFANPVPALSLNLSGTMDFAALEADGNQFTFINDAWATLPAQTGVDPTGTNRVLVGQFTTNGVFTFKINVALSNPSNQVEEYFHTSAANPGSQVSPFLTYPQACVAPVITSATSNGPICAGAALNLSAAATGDATITYSWSGPNSFSSTQQNPTITAATVAAAGTYTVTASNGCAPNATATVNVVVNPSTTNTTTVSQCDSYTWPVNGTTYTQSGTYTSVSGCATQTLVLTITPSTNNTTTVSQCDSYTWPVNGTTYTQSGTYTSVSGCATQTLVLTITPSTNNTTTVSECDSYTWSVNGTTYTQSGTYTSVNGCATETLVLTITPSTNNTTTVSECDSYTWSVNGTTYTQSGTYTSVNGCATETLVLTITPSTNNTTTVSECDSYTWAVNGTTYTQSGTYTSVNGCATETLVLTILTGGTNTTTESACDSYTWSVNGTTYTQSGTYTSVTGCSTEILVLTIITSTNNTTTESACGSYTWSVNGTTYTQSGTYTSVNGCATETLVLTVSIPGTACDDNNPATGNDQLDANCICVGTPLTVDCEGTPGGTALPGTPCNDGNASTGNDTWTNDCQCVGQVIDCLGVAGGSALPGTPCNDANAGTINDTWSNDCQCVGIPTGCTENITLNITLDAFGSQTTWSLLQQGTGTVVEQGGPYIDGIAGAVIVEELCVPVGCYRLVVSDAAGDGINGGGYVLRTSGSNGVRIIDNSNNGGFGSTSAIIGNGGFCLPLGNDKLIFTSCDKLDWVNGQFLAASENAAVSAQWGVGNQTDDGYEFWIFDPNGTYGYARFRNHATGEGYPAPGPLRATHMKINNWSPNQIPTGVLMNVRVRSRVNGVNSAWGQTCRFKIDPIAAACPATKLVDQPGVATFSCGVSRNWGGSSRLWARAVSGATQYQFRFTSSEMAAPVVRSTTTQVLQLNWNPALANGTYQVQVRAFVNGQWCATNLPWGDVCNVTITNSPASMSGMPVETSGTTVDAQLSMFPNPNRGDLLNVSLSAVEEGVNTVSVDIYDLTGAMVSSRTIAVNDGMVYQVLELNEMASGLYMVNITAGSKRYTERLVISK